MTTVLLRFFLAALSAAAASYAGFAGETPPPSRIALQVLSVQDCPRIAMGNNRQRPASRFAVAMAEAQHRQALAGYWPQLSAKSGWIRLNEAPNFIFPVETMYVPPQTVNVPGGTAAVTIPANAFGPGFPPAADQMPVSFPGQSVSTAAQAFPIPEQDIKLANPENFAASGNLTWLLYDGGMRKGYREQALGAVEAAQAEARRTDLEIADSVARLYYGALLARQLHQVGTDTLARMEATLEPTESLYRNGAGKVNKTDYLENVVMAETIRSTVADLSKNEAAAEAALKALDGAMSAARSGYYPKVALTGELHRWWNSYTAGMATAQNKEGWSIGVGVEIPIFDGFPTRNKMAETLARVSKLKEEELLLREGIGLQIRELFLGPDAASKTCEAANRAMAAARENRDLTSRAYQSELVETEKVIRTQLLETLTTAQYLKARYDLVAIEPRISLVVGKEIAGRLNLKS